MLALGINPDVWPWIWMTLAVVLAGIELKVVRRDFVVLPWAASAFMAGVFGFFGAAPWLQGAVFVIGGVLLFVALGPVRRLTSQTSDNDE